MKYVLNAQDYQYFDSPNGQSLKQLISNIPASVWESLQSESFQYGPAPTDETSTQQEILLEHFEISELNEHQRMMFKAGVAGSALMTIDEYQALVNEAFALYEGIWDTTKEFLRAITEGGSAIGILHLILDIIGLVPGSWVGFPIDVVANLLNALIYAARGMWFLSILSAVAAIPANYMFKGLKITFTPFAKILDKLGIAIFKADSAAVKIASAELKTAAGVEKTSMLANALSGFVSFIRGAFVTMLKGLASLLDKALSFVTFGAFPKGQVLKLVEEYIEVPLMKAVRGSEEAITVLKEGDAAVHTSAVDTLGKAAGNLDQVEKEALMSKFGKLAGGDGDMIAKVTNSRAFKEMVEAGAPMAAQEAYIHAALARYAFSDALKLEGKIITDPRVVEILTQAGMKVEPGVLMNAVKSGDSNLIGRIFEDMVSNPAVVRNMTEGEAALAKIYATYPEQFIKHGRRFDDYLVTLTRISSRFAYREKIGRKLLMFAMRQIAKAVMSNHCYDEFMEKAGAVKSTEDLAKLGATQVFEAVDTATRRNIEKAIMEKYQITPEMLQTPEAKAEFDALVNEAIAEATKKNETNCFGSKELVEKATGQTLFNPGLYNDKNKYGEKELGKTDYDALNDVSKNTLKELNLPTDIDPMHDMQNADPMVLLYFSDVYDSEAGKIHMNESSTSRLNGEANRLKRQGNNDFDVEALKREVEKHWAEGTEPAEVQRFLNKDSIPESVQINKGRRFMTFENFKNTIN